MLGMRKQTIVVADDDADMRAMVKELLTEAGYRVVAAKDGAEETQNAIHLRELLLIPNLHECKLRIGAVSPTH